MMAVGGSSQVQSFSLETKTSTYIYKVNKEFLWSVGDENRGNERLLGDIRSPKKLSEGSPLSSKTVQNENIFRM